MVEWLPSMCDILCPILSTKMNESKGEVRERKGDREEREGERGEKEEISTDEILDHSS